MKKSKDNPLGLRDMWFMDFYEQRCPTCLNYSCNCSQRVNGDFDSLDVQVERSSEERRGGDNG